MRNTLRAGLSVALLAVIAMAQEKPPAEKAPEDRVGGLRFIDVTEVTVVNVDVTVRDKNGPVSDLAMDDFEVYQDGELQELTNFAAYTSAARATVTAAAPTATETPVEMAQETAAVPEPPREPRFVALFIDNENILPLNRNRVLTPLKAWVRDNLHPPDQMMVVSYQRSLKIPQPFTTSPEDVISALNTLKMYTGGRSDVNSSRRDIEQYIRDRQNEGDHYVQAMSRVESFAREQRNNLVFTVRAFQELVTTMSGLPGKKSIIYVSDGLPMTPGLELFYEAQEVFREPTLVTRSMTYSATDLFRSLVTTAAASGVTVYAIDARGLETFLGIEAENRTSRSTLSASMLRSNYQDSLQYVADETGGMAIINTNNVAPGLDRIADDMQTYYSLGYRLVPTGKDRPHRVEVKVKGHPDYKLSYKPLFIEKTLPTKIADRVMSGLAYEIDDNPLSIALNTGEPQPGSTGNWLLPVEIRIPIHNIALIPDGDSLVGYLMVYYAARDNEGKQSDLQRTEHQVTVPNSDYEAAKHQHWTVTASLLLEPGTYRISVGVRDELTNQAGYASVRRAVHPEEARR